MSIRRTFGLVLGATALTVAAVAAAHGLANASQNRVVVQRLLFGQVDRAGRFRPVAGRGATNVPRNAIVMFVFSGAVDMGPHLRAMRPETEQERIAREANDADEPGGGTGYEPGASFRNPNDERDAFYVATGSVSPYSISIATSGVGGLTEAPGHFFKFLRPGTGRPTMNRLLFNPRWTQATFGKPGEIDPNPAAFASGATYTISVAGGPQATDPFNAVKNLDGELLGAAFTSTFHTTSRYLQDFTRPTLKRTDPTDGAEGVNYYGDIDLEFSEAMDVSTFVLPRFQGDDQWTVKVVYADNDSTGQPNGALGGRNVLGTVRMKPQSAGKVIQFQPLQGYGRGPFKIDVTVTTGVTDLAGNNILRGSNFSFMTQLNPDAENFNTLDELFSTNTQEDLAFTPSGDYSRALWNVLGNRGILTTTAGETGVDAQGPNAPTVRTTTNSVNIWYHLPIRFQLWWPASMLSNRARTITGFSWIQGVAYGRNYTNTSVQMGHASQGVDLAGFSATTGVSNLNFSDTPVPVVLPVTYSTTPQAPFTADPVRGPAFVRNFNYDGTRGLVMDINTNGDPASNGTWERWRIDPSYPVPGIVYSIQGGAATTNSWLFSTRFHFISPGGETQSKWYDLGIGNARLLPQQVVPFTQPTGTSVVFQWEGAKESATPNTPDLGNTTGWVSDIRQATNYRFVRFRITLNNNTTTLVSPTIDTITVPYVYK